MHANLKRLLGTSWISGQNVEYNKTNHIQIYKITSVKRMGKRGVARIILQIIFRLYKTSCEKKVYVSMVYQFLRLLSMRVQVSNSGIAIQVYWNLIVQKMVGEIWGARFPLLKRQMTIKQEQEARMIHVVMNESWIHQQLYTERFLDTDTNIHKGQNIHIYFFLLSIQRDQKK